MPHITLPTRKHLLQELLILTTYFQITLTFTLVVSKDNIKKINNQKLFKREKNFDKESLVAEVINIDWKSVLEIEKGNPNLTFENYNKKMKEVINTYLP